MLSHTEQAWARLSELAKKSSFAAYLPLARQGWSLHWMITLMNLEATQCPQMNLQFAALGKKTKTTIQQKKDNHKKELNVEEWHRRHLAEIVEEIIPWW
ncbi:hypothetical protein MHYP_G00065780 [Metynnis hypsauchen]